MYFWLWTYFSPASIFTTSPSGEMQAAPEDNQSVCPKIPSEAACSFPSALKDTFGHYLNLRHLFFCNYNNCSQGMVSLLAADHPPFSLAKTCTAISASAFWSGSVIH